MKNALNSDFEAFWQAYPRKVGKLAAVKAYQKARTQATQDELLHGIDEYVKHKPDWQAWAHPSSWLNAGRWMDELLAPVPTRADVDWWQECKARHGGSCTKRWDHEMRLRREQAGEASA